MFIASFHPILIFAANISGVKLSNIEVLCLSVRLQRTKANVARSLARAGLKQRLTSSFYFFGMGYRLSVKQQDPQEAESWIWEIVNSNQPRWVKRSMIPFRSSGLATAAGIAALKQLSGPAPSSSSSNLKRAAR
jgi:hypothetical protein